MILVVGAGFLGVYLIKYLSGNTDERILALSRDVSVLPVFKNTEYLNFDILDRNDIMKLCGRCKNEPLTVFYFAALHNVDYLYEHPEEGKKVNLDALSFFLDTMPNIKKLFFASTDCVYGENPPGTGKFKETDNPSPINEYGRQKLEAESIVRSHCFTSVRFSYMLGKSLLQRKHFYDKIYEKLSEGQNIDMIDGMIRSALSYETAAELLAKLSFLPEEVLPDVVNLCSDGEYTKYDLGRLIAEKHGFSAENVHRITEKDAENFFKDLRASRAVMDNTRIKTLLGIDHIWLEV